MKIGFVGLGSMGMGMAQSLLRAGLDLSVYNRTAPKAEPLRARGARIAPSLNDLSEVDVLCTMLADDSSVQAVCLDGDKLALPLKPGAVHLSHSTISPQSAAKLADAHMEHGVHYVGAPVLGRPNKAADGTLTIIVSGDAAAIEKASLALRAMSARIFPMGAAPEAAHMAKLGMNYMLACALEAMSEGFAMARAGGIAPDAFLDLVTGSIFGAPVYEVYGPLVAHETIESPGFKTTLGLKDVTLAVEAAGQAGADLPMANAIQTQMQKAIDGGYADHDWASIAIVAARAAGLPEPNKKNA